MAGRAVAWSRRATCAGAAGVRATHLSCSDQALDFLLIEAGFMQSRAELGGGFDDRMGGLPERGQTKHEDEVAGSVQDRLAILIDDGGAERIQKTEDGIQETSAASMGGAVHSSLRWS